MGRCLPEWSLYERDMGCGDLCHLSAPSQKVVRTASQRAAFPRSRSAAEMPNSCHFNISSALVVIFVCTDL